MWLLGGLLALLACGVGVLTVGYPSVAATACPTCFGLVRVEADLYAQRGLSAEQRDRLIGLRADADQRVADFYGGRRTTPRVLACFNTGCYQRIGGGGEKGIAVRNWAVMLSPDGIDPVIAAHELSHVEFHQRLGSHAGQVPQWFDEGLAVLVAGDPRYLRPDPGSSPGADRCLVAADGQLPGSLAGWLTAASADRMVYAKAACRVSRWVTGHGGPPAVRDLIDRLHHGDSFATALGA